MAKRKMRREMTKMLDSMIAGIGTAHIDHSKPGHMLLVVTINGQTRKVGTSSSPSDDDNCVKYVRQNLCRIIRELT